MKDGSYSNKQLLHFLEVFETEKNNWAYKLRETAGVFFSHKRHEKPIFYLVYFIETLL